MRLFIALLVICISTSATGQWPGQSKRASGDTHLMGSGAKNVQGAGVNKDGNKYKRLESKTREELQEEKIGNNPTGTDTIQGKNSKVISD